MHTSVATDVYISVAKYFQTLSRLLKEHHKYLVVGKLYGMVSGVHRKVKHFDNTPIQYTTIFHTFKTLFFLKTEIVGTR